ncbi:MAG: transglycosylase SLT domain-containing protein [Gemmatimonadales bacterium]
MRTKGLALSAVLLVIGSGCGQQVAMRPMPSPSAAPRSRVASPPAPVAQPAAATVMAARTPAPAPKPPLKPKPAPTRPAPTRVAAKPAPAATAAGKSGKVYIRKPKVDSMALEQALLQEHSYIPLSFVLSLRSGNQDISDRVAAAVLYEADRANLSPSFIAAVLMVENTPMDPTAESSVGAVGLMQVMPMHEGGWGCPADLQEIEANICHGARLLHMLVQKSGSTEMALRRYNGCLGKLVTPSCLRYPKRVMRLAASIRRDMLTVPLKVYEIAEQAPPPPPPYLRRPELLEDEVTPAPVDTLWARISAIPSPIDTQLFTAAQ